MANQRQYAANRTNAKRSTGPRTVQGKAVSCLNARRHGLAAPLRSEPGMDEEIERLARAIAGERSDLMDLARRIAEADLELRRIWRARLVPPPTDLVPSPNLHILLKAFRAAFRRKTFRLERLAESARLGSECSQLC